MGSKERSIVAKLIEIVNYVVKKKSSFQNYLKDNNSFIQSYLNVRSSFYNLFLENEKSDFKSDLRKLQGVRQIIEINADKDVKKGSYGFDLTKLLGDLTASKKAGVKKTPRWKTHPPAVTHEEINSQTQRLLVSLASSESVSVRLKRLEDLLNHLTRHPTAKNFAVKKGAIGILLFIRRHTNDGPTHETILQILAILGYADPPRSNGIRILSIDGGGMRGIAVIRMLQRIEEISGKKICDLFDFICGVSTGAIITSCLIPPNNMSLNHIYDLYRELSSRVFNQSAFWGASMLLWSGAYYDTSLWEKILSDHVGKLTLIDSAKDPLCPKVAIVSTIINQSKIIPFVFRNYAEPYNRSSEYLGSCRNTIFEAVRASAAAPTVFEEFKIGDLMHQDGGLVVNNPTAIALHEATTLWPEESVSCVVSIGTGRYEPIITIDETVESSKSSSSWKLIFTKILESATDTEAVHRILNDLLPEDTYFRLNPHMSRLMTMDEISELKILELEQDTKMYCRRNEDKFHDMVSKLSSSRSPLKKFRDYMNLKLKLLGFTL
ncbi:calcium-independent phospholipase A2-gamma [Halyomorpha halys]|uniref:calcium-independent phospholipase A2-gamma n=1 Tax=Halyomorpha halys TaxID=286706 RepID=UPI0006D525E4|nr:calcium-independent phospholipase A2-gamma [Halyomorpha halys]